RDVTDVTDVSPSEEGRRKEGRKNFNCSGYQCYICSNSSLSSLHGLCVTSGAIDSDRILYRSIYRTGY
ncbi:hypothetical protein QT970_17195, partial [Microcoleus sp. herbarium8]|uniref:hypothetical protein n=1 Tax=Microcoleus sp. herbarium8 TaxID=3055436 RepID=UPI002FD2A465